MHGQCSRMDIKVKRELCSVAIYCRDCVAFVDNVHLPRASKGHQVAEWTLTSEGHTAVNDQRDKLVKQGQGASFSDLHAVKLRLKQGHYYQLLAAMVANRSLHWCRWRSARDEGRREGKLLLHRYCYMCSCCSCMNACMFHWEKSLLHVHAQLYVRMCVESLCIIITHYMQCVLHAY